MRAVGEKSFSSLSQTRKCPKSLRKMNIAVSCLDCGIEEKSSDVLMKKYHKDGYKCFDCRQKNKAESKQEMNEAIIALAKRKALIKGAK